MLWACFTLVSWRYPKIMKKYFIFALVFLAPFFAFAAKPSAGLTPSSRFYFFEVLFEKIDLSFTFSSEKKAQKALGYADERLAEAEAVAEEKNTDAVKTAIAGYESNMALATEESKQIKDKGKTEELLNSITDNTSKHQEILLGVLSKVPDEAKGVITQVIEAIRKGQEKVVEQIVDLKDEVEQPKKEIAELKSKEKDQTKIVEEPNKQKPENVSVPIKPSVPHTSENTQAPKSATPLPPALTQTPTPIIQAIVTPAPISAIPTPTPSGTIPATPAEPATLSGTPKSEDTTPTIISNTQATSVAETYPTTVHATGQEATSATVSWVTDESSTMTAIGPNGEVSHGMIGRMIGR